MTLRLINIGLLLAFSICYMEWGKDQSAFVFDAIYEVLFKKQNLIESITHPVIIFGLGGQILLLIAAFKRNKIVNLIGILMLGTVVLLILLTGLISLNPKTILSVTPFLVLAVLYFIKTRKKASLLRA